LAEHIDTALAERPGSIDQVVRELGDPRTIAASAATENDTAVKGSDDIAPTPVRRPRNPLTPLLIIALSVPVAIVNQVLFDNETFAVVVRLIGIVLLCRSVFWTGAQKTAGVMAVLALPVVINLTDMNSNSFDGVPDWLFNVVLTGLVLGGCVWLWLVRRRTV
jgi:uncharacterized membrane protein